MKIIYEFPEFDTGLYAGSEFYMSDGNGHITIHVMERGNITIVFYKIRYHKFTALPNCTKDQVNAYFRLIDMGESDELKNFIKTDRSTNKSYKSLSHLIIFLDETGCHELFCESIKLPN